MPIIIDFWNMMVLPVEYDKKLNYNDALLYCSLLNVDGYNDWTMAAFDDMMVIDRYVDTSYHSIRNRSHPYWVKDRGIRWGDGTFDKINDKTGDNLVYVKAVRKSNGFV